MKTFQDLIEKLDAITANIDYIVKNCDNIIKQPENNPDNEFYLEEINENTLHISYSKEGWLIEIDLKFDEDGYFVRAYVIACYFDFDNSEEDTRFTDMQILQAEGFLNNKISKIL